MNIVGIVWGIDPHITNYVANNNGDKKESPTDGK